jgi:hypothetical protein
MIVFTATLALIIATVVALAGITTSSRSIHPPGDHFVSSGQHLSTRSAGKLSLYGIGVRMAGLLGLSMLPGASTTPRTPPRQRSNITIMSGSACGKKERQ